MCSIMVHSILQVRFRVIFEINLHGIPINFMLEKVLALLMLLSFKYKFIYRFR